MEIINNGASLKIINGTNVRLVYKTQIREISIIKTTIIKMDLGLGALHNVFINYSDVTNPVTANPDALRDAINAMLANAAIAGGSTEQKQVEGIAELQNIKSSINALGSKIDQLNDKLFMEPLQIDESNPQIIYRGFALPGAATSAAVWAIQRATINGDVTIYQWAAGNKNFDKIWDNRAALTYN
jgi:hypothetical protein